jgi:hypothetical protein
MLRPDGENNNPVTSAGVRLVMCLFPGTLPVVRGELLFSMRREGESTIRPLSKSLHIDGEKDVYENEGDENSKLNRSSAYEMYLIE